MAKTYEAVNSGRKIKAHPTKSFFIRMITRDIDPIACILDLIDNSIQSLVKVYKFDASEKLMGSRRYTLPKKAKIDITIDADKIVLEDTCGGISIRDAEEDVFIFGREKPDRDHAALGYYGIGMKRAIFKLGKDIIVESTDPDGYFKVAIDVDKWERSPEWELEFDQAVQFSSPKKNGLGTIIRITKLNEGIKRVKASATYLSLLKQKLSTTYALFISLGIQIRINGSTIDAFLPEIATSKEIGNSRAKLSVQGVDILIIAGVSSRTDRKPHGWYVFCNGRMILEADKSRRTGWGDQFPQWHTKYNHFVGFVYFRSKRIEMLPWTTTKDGILFESPVYQDALSEMGIQGHPVLNYLSNLYPVDLTEGGEIEREILKNAKSVSVENLSKRNSSFEYKRHKSKLFSTQASIAYKVRQADLDKVKRALGSSSLSNASVGERTFIYYMDREC